MERLSLDLVREMQAQGISYALGSYGVPSPFNHSQLSARPLGLQGSSSSDYPSIEGVQEVFCQTFHGILLLGAKARRHGARVTWGYHERQAPLLGEAGLLPLIWPLVDRVIAPSEFVLKDLSIPQDVQVIVEPPGIDMEVFLNPQLRPLPTEQGWVLGTVGNFFPQKKHLFLLDVLEKVRKTVPNVELRVVAMSAHGPTEEKFMSEVAGRSLQKHVRVIRAEGDRVAEEYRRMDLCLLPGSDEAFGLCHLEALASGVSVVSAFEGNRQRLGVLCDYIGFAESGSVQSWAEQILRSRNIALSRRKEAQDFVSKHYGRSQIRRWVRELMH